MALLSVRRAEGALLTDCHEEAKQFWFCFWVHPQALVRQGRTEGVVENPSQDKQSEGAS